MNELKCMAIDLTVTLFPVSVLIYVLHLNIYQ